jgi:bacterioferritin
MKGAERTTAVLDFGHGERRRRTVRAKPEQGAAKDANPGDRAAVLDLLNAALATKLDGALRYRRHHFMARSLASRRICDELLVHSDEELSHADLIADRIVALGGEPDYSPASLLQQSRAPCVRAASIVDLITENLVAARSAFDSYRELIAQLREDDPTTRRMLEGILAVKEAHADELAELLQGASKTG